MACSASARLTASLALRSSEVSALGCRLEICSIQRINAEVDADALAAVRQWRFRPARLNGKVRAVYFDLTVRYP